MANMQTREESKEPSLLVLPDELIDIILSYRFLDYRDLCRFAQVCIRFNRLACCSEIWKKKALTRWKRWRTPTDSHWKEVFKKRFKTEMKIKEVLEKLGREFGPSSDVSERQYEELVHLENDDNYAGFLACSLEEYVFGDPRLTNLTYKHYAEKLYIYLRRNFLKKEWQNLLNKPIEEQHLEDGALIIAKWMDHKIDDSMTDYMKSSLDGLAERVRRIVGEEAEPLDFNQQEHPYYITDPSRCSEIINGIRLIIFEEDKFCGNTQDYYNVKNSFITEVLKTKQGIPISLAVVFIAVARRLRVKIEPVNAPRHFLIRWCSNPASRTNRYTYIDCFDGGKVYSEEQGMQQFLSGLLYPFETPEDALALASPKDIFIRMATNILNIYQSASRVDSGLQYLCDALKLLILIKPGDRRNAVMLARIHLHLGINLDQCIEILEEQSLLDIAAIRSLESAREQIERQERLRNQPVVPKLRSDPKNKDVAFEVGMVMRHRRYHYGCVIYGWDPFCDMSESWILQMGVDRLPNGRNQPFYNVLGDDGSLRYAAQENLEEEPNQAFNPHGNLGRYFEHWTGTKYLPNYYLRQEYPEDVGTDE